MRTRLRIILSSIALLAVASACGGGSAGTSPGPGSGSLTVSGKVVTIYGTPAANISIVVDGQGPIVTDPSGNFEFTGVRVPYDAIVFEGGGGGAVVWQGLTRGDPTFVYTAGGGGGLTPTASASVAGTISGGVGFPIPVPPPDVETDVNLWVQASDLFGAGSATPNTLTGDYSAGSVEWAGIGPFELTITALQYTLDGAGLAATFTGFGQLQTPILDGDVLVGQNVAMGAVGTTTISGTTTIPPAVSALVRIVIITLPGGGFFALPTDSGGTPNFLLRAPDVPGLTRTLLTYGITLTGEVVFHSTEELPAPAAGLAIPLPNIAGPVLPIDGVAGVDYSTVFTTSEPLDDVVYQVRFEPNGGGPGPQIELVTAETAFTIPDLSAYGVTIPPGAHYDWDVTARGPAMGVDDIAVGGTFVPGLFALLGPGEAFGSSSESRSFFFAP